MNEVDYIIVGCGLAGIALCEILSEHDKTFVVFDNGSQQSSSVAAGMYNPVILKRFTPVWRAEEQLKLVPSFYKKLEEKLHKTLDYRFPLKRRFTSIEEQNQWFTAADKPRLAPFMDLELTDNDNPNVDAPHGFGTVLHTGRVFTEALVSTYQNYLREKGLLMNDSFEYEQLKVQLDGLSYQSYKAQHIVFAEGYGIKHNPFFNYLPLSGNKGEVLTVKIKGLRLKEPIKSGVFVIPLGDELYRVGATYNNHDKQKDPTEQGKAELLDKLNSFIRLPVEVIDHRAGIRPTVKDRRPLVGQHPKHKQLYVLNGFGSRGVMIAPYATKQLFNSIESNEPLEDELDIKRFENLVQEDFLSNLGS